MIKAGSLLYSVYVCLMISVMSAALIFIFNYNLDLSTRQIIQSDLLDLCDSCIDYYLSESENFSDLTSEKIDVFDNGYMCEFSKAKWGSYTLLTVKAFFKKDTIERRAFVGEELNKNKLALYVCDWDKEIKLSGSTNIKGDMKLPLAGYKVINILGNNQLNKPKFFGRTFKSSQNLPETLKLPISNSTINATVTSLSKINRKSQVYNSFNNKTLLLELSRGEQLNNMSFKGNIIIKSNDTLYIDSSIKIEDVIIQAPKLVIKNGFVGRGQFYAENEVFIEENVVLSYPSNVVLLPSVSLLDKKITLSKNSKIYGGVIVDAKTFDQKEGNEMIIEENAMIVGTLYCNGKLQLQGKVIGTVYANKFKLETKSGNYEDVLLNSIIDAINMPENFIYLPLFKQQQNQTYGIIKNL